jgi:PAS domain S-box-containing protein
MSYVTVLWSVVASCALLLAFMHGFVWLLDRKARASLAFAVLALSVVGVVIGELAVMRADTPLEWVEYLRWAHVPVFMVLVSIPVFIRLYFDAGRTWLMWAIIGMRCLVLVMNFSGATNFNFERVDSIARVRFLGELVSVPGDAVTSRWQWLGLVSTLLVLLFLADASLTMWRSGSRDARRRAIVIGSATFVAIALALLYSQLMIWRVMQWPVLISPPFILLFGAMALEMSRDTLRSARLARELRNSEERLLFSADAAGVGLWAWDAANNLLWATNTARAMFGVARGAALDTGALRAQIHGDDLSRIDGVMRKAATDGVEWETEFRIALPDGETRWLMARGRSEVDEQGKLAAVRGVLRDTTGQRHAGQEIEELRRELLRAGRVSVLGTLSSSIAHEISQPLGAILTNAEVAAMLLKNPQPDFEELRAIVVDIERDGLRAGEIINSLRSLLKRRQLAIGEILPENLVQDVATLVRMDAASRNLTLESRCDAGLPMIRGDRVHLTQVLINLVINAMDAVADLPAERRRVSLLAQIVEPGWMEIAVEDQGPGIAPEIMKRVFDPFFTTKTSGTGLGLSVSRTIVDAHQGQLLVENNREHGATFRLRLRTV